MANADLKFYDDTDATVNPVLTFAPENGTPSTPQVLHLWNDKGAVADSDTAEDVLVGLLSGVSGSGSYSAQGVLAANRYVEVQAYDVTGTGIVVQSTPYTPVGKGAFLSLRPIPKNCARYLRVRLNVPGGVGVIAEDVILVAYVNGVSVPLEDGHYEGGGQGILAGVGDAGYTAILSGGLITANGTPDDKVDISTVVGVHAGDPYCIVGAEDTLSNLDVASAALGSGESYLATVSVGSDGAGGFELHFTKSAKGTYPLSVDLRPEAPDGEEVLGYIERQFDATIEQDKIDQDTLYYGGFALEYDAASPTVYVHGGRALVGNRFVRRRTPSPLTLDLSDDTWIWLNPDASFSKTLDTTAPNARALLLWKATTDGSGVTAVVDLRTWTAPNLSALQFVKLGNLADEDKAYAVLPAGGPCYLLPLGPLTFALGATGSGSGSNSLDLEASEGGAAFASILAVLPAIAYNAADPVAKEGQPNVFKLAGGSRLRVRLDTVAAGTPTDLMAALLYARPAA